MLSSYNKSVLDGWPSAVAAVGFNKCPAETDPMDVWPYRVLNGGTPIGWFKMENPSI